MRKLYLFLLVNMTMLSCIAHTEQVVENETNLQAIVDMNDELTMQTPTEFAMHNLRDFFTTNSVDTRAPQEHVVKHKEKVDTFNQSWTRFIKTLYNKHNYAQKLSQDSSHVVQFLELSNELDLGTETVYVCLRLFYNKIKGCELVDDTVVGSLLEAMPENLEHHFVESRPTTDLTFVKKNLENMLLNKFTYHMPEFRASPDTFLSTLSTEITQYFQEEVSNTEKERLARETRERLRNTIVKLFEVALTKTIWQPAEHKTIWKSFTGIAQGFQNLGSHGIIDHSDDLDDLLWSLIHRFCFFLDLAGASLPSSFYAEVEKDLRNGTVFFLEYQEQDEAIATKKDILIGALLQAKAKALAYEKSGIITMPLR